MYSNMTKTALSRRDQKLFLCTYILYRGMHYQVRCLLILVLESRERAEAFNNLMHVDLDSGPEF